MTPQLPTVMIDCDEYEDLTEGERLALLRRVEDALEFGASLAQRGRRDGHNEFYLFVENLELDVSRLQEFDLPWGGALSRWLMHHSWTFGTTPAEMRDQLSSAMVRVLDANEPSIDASLADFDRWLYELGSALVEAATSVFGATSFSAAMAHQVAIDILLGRVLSACYKLRLSRLIPR